MTDVKVVAPMNMGTRLVWDEVSKKYNVDVDDLINGIDALGKLSLAGFTQNLGRNGWCRLPNGLILQWGEFVDCYTDVDRLLHFPIAFPTTCLYAGIGKIMSPRTATVEFVQITGYSAVGFYASTSQIGRGTLQPDTLTFSYFAIGY